MAIIDVVKVEMSNDELCKKFPSEDLRLGTQLVVYPTQIAFFVRGGQLLDDFEAGTYTLKTDNIPLINKIINLPFGSRSPFQAEVWYINLTSKLDMKWSTSSPIQFEDPKYGIIVPVSAEGQYGIKICDPHRFLGTLMGNMKFFSADKVGEYFKGQMMSMLNSAISKKITQEGISILDINSHLVEMSEFCGNEVSVMFERYGIKLIEFAISSITVPQNDPSVLRLKEAKDLAARLKITGRDIYQMERSFDVLEKAAGNEGAAGSMASLGAGFGAAAGIGSAMGQMSAQTLNTNVVPPPIQQSYYLYMNGQQYPNMPVQTIVSMIQQGMVNAAAMVWKAGIPNWIPISAAPEFAQFFMQAQMPTPPPPPIL